MINIPKWEFWLTTTPILGGRVTLYLRDDHKNPKYQARFNLVDKNGKAVKKRLSLGTNDYDAAYEKALEKYGELKNKLSTGQQIFIRKFDDVAKAYLADKEEEAKYGKITQARYDNIEKMYNRWIKPFFGKMSMTAFSKDTLKEYWYWRINYWTSDEGEAEIEALLKAGKKKPRTVAVPKGTTLNQTKIVLSAIFNYAVDNRIMDYRDIPNLSPPIKIEIDSAEGFDLDEWSELQEYMEGWIDEAHNDPSMKDVAFARKRVFLRALFIKYGGLRVSDTNALKWKHITFDKVDSEGNKYIEVYATTKGKERPCALPIILKKITQGWRKMLKSSGDEDLVFQSEKGGPASNDDSTWKRMLRKAGKEFDHKGGSRTLTSLRHTYASDKILYSNLSIYEIADSMGTSVKMIEMTYADQIQRRKGGTLAKPVSLARQITEKARKKIEKMKENPNLAEEEFKKFISERSDK